MKLTTKQCKKILRKQVPSKYIKIFLYQQLKLEENFETFCRLLLPKAFTKPFAKFHHEIINEFNKNDNSAIAAPRGHGKSTLIGQGYVIHQILYKKKNYIVYTSQNHLKSTQFLEPIKNELLNNPLIKFIYGEQKLTSTVDDNGKNREDVFDINNVRVQALSFEKNIRGLKYGNQRPDLIILDDIEDDERVLNPELRRKDNDKVNKQIIPSLDSERGILKMIGTILHHDSLLVNKLNSWNGKIYRACEVNNEGDIIEDTILFPDLFTKEKLLKIKKTIGSNSFQSEYLNNPIDDKSSIIKRSWVIQCFDETKSFSDPIPENCVLGVDFAYSDAVISDKSAFVTIDKETKTIKECITRKGMSVTEQFNLIEDMHQRNHYSVCALEENSIRSMSKELKNYSFPFMLFWTGNSDTPEKRHPDPYFDGKRQTVSKMNMINRLATQFENKNIKIPYKTAIDREIANQILDECTSFARSNGRLVEVGVHPDIPIGIAYALEAIEKDNFILDW